MKKAIFPAIVFLAMIAEIIVLIVFASSTPDFSRDAVAANEVLQTVTADFNALETHENVTALDYVVLDNDGNVLYKTGAGLSENMNSAITHMDTVLDIEIDGAVAGKIIIYNDSEVFFKTKKRNAIAVLSAIVAVQAAFCVGYALYLYAVVVKPFSKLKGFAERVACGNLDIPLEMDRRNLFGAFTESFDIMRSELKKARLAEAQAQQSKKELVAKLSHDIKTPVASIKAVSEVGRCVATSKKDKTNYEKIIGKADQINTLVTNLFSAALEELQQLTVCPANIESGRVKALIENADYMHRANVPALPECLVYADESRLQQVFDNVFANAYKYANTDISVTAERGNDFLRIVIEDFGGGVNEEELSVLKEKFKRGSNAVNIEGAGLGLYISDYFMKEMLGGLNVENGTHGLKVTVSILLSGANLIKN